MDICFRTRSLKLVWSLYILVVREVGYIATGAKGILLYPGPNNQGNPITCQKQHCPLVSMSRRLCCSLSNIQNILKKFASFISIVAFASALKLEFAFAFSSSFLFVMSFSDIDILWCPVVYIGTVLPLPISYN